MDRRVWVLVEWVDESTVFPSYGVINIDTFSYKDNDLQPGKQTLISLKHNEPRCAKIIRISDSKRQVKEHKDFLERQDQQVKNVLQLCMRTIKEMKSEQFSNSVENASSQINMTGQQNILPRVISANDENSESDTDLEHPQKNHQIKMATYINQTHHQSVRYESNAYHKMATQNPTTSQRRRSIVSSTPLPGKNVPENIRLCFDQGTQTDNTWVPPQAEKIEEIESVLKHLYGRFQSLVMRVSNATNGTIEISESEQNGDISYAEPNDSWVARNNLTENVEIPVDDNNVTMAETAADVIVDPATSNLEVKAPVKMEAAERKTPNDNTRVRRMSAQTTYSNEMVPIGNGHASVPARLLNEIDWSSHTTATRQLLQAIFSRKVLATHSLTGKKSPAHLNKPAKKLLNPHFIEDIVTTVSSKSGVSKNLVRNAITVKCTDEAKLYRNRQRFKFSRTEKRQQNDENLPPSSTHSSDDSSHNVVP